MANKKFLEEYPLYRKHYTTFNRWKTLGSLPKPAINMHCRQCESEQTFNMTNEYYNARYGSNTYAHETFVCELLYQCSACAESQYGFMVRFGLEDLIELNEQNEEIPKEVVYVEKVGQYPGWNIKMDKELEALLDDHADFYKRGLINESQGYGIGAFAYYRRIVEEIIDTLLTSIEELIPIESKDKYTKALVLVKNTRVTQEKIELVKDLLPDSLRPNGINPLGALHAALSEGLHAEDEETCLEYAEAVRDTLVFLVNRLIRTKSENKSFSLGMQKLLEKKSTK